MNHTNTLNNLASPIFDEWINLICGFISFVLNFLPFIYWKSLKSTPIFLILLSLSVSNSLKSSACYIIGMKVILFRYYYGDKIIPIGQGTLIWYFIGKQSVNWSTLALIFDRFVSTAYPELYSGIGTVYKSILLLGSWSITIFTLLITYTRGIKFWTEIFIYKNRSPALVGFFRCLDTACSVSCVFLLFSTLMVQAKRLGRWKTSKQKWQEKIFTKVVPPRKKAVVRAPLRNTVRERCRKKKGKPIYMIPTFISFISNFIMWLGPSIVAFARTASLGEINISESTMLFLSLFQTLHGSADVVVYTLKDSEGWKKLKRWIWCGRNENSQLITSTSSTTASPTAHLVGKNSAGGTSSAYSDFTPDLEDGSSYFPY